MSRHQITCINKADRPNPYERILAIGGQKGDGSWWKMSQSDAILNIELGKFSFFVRVGLLEADVIVAKSRFGHKYIKTRADGESPDNLLNLPECPK